MNAKLTEQDLPDAVKAQTDDHFSEWDDLTFEQLGLQKHTDSSVLNSTVFCRLTPHRRNSVLADLSSLATSGFHVSPAVSRLDSVTFSFKQKPATVLVVKKIRCAAAMDVCVPTIRMLQSRGLSVMVEADCVAELTDAGLADLRPLSEDVALREREVDLLLSIGGDGTFLWACRFFQHCVPPVMSVAGGGSLGYLTKYSALTSSSCLERIVAGDTFTVELRSRLQMILLDAEGNAVSDSYEAAVNEFVVARGAVGSTTTLDIHVNRTLFTTLVGDGVMLATATGSTAYSMSAGGSVVHPKVPGILLTPINPHSISVRPLILPETSVLNISRAKEGDVYYSVDGQVSRQIPEGHSVLVARSPWPLPVIQPRDLTEHDPWLECLKTKLNFNLR